MRMSNKKFNTIMCPLLSLLVAIPTIGTITANEYAASLDGMLGRGEKHINQVSDVDESLLSFYKHNYSTATQSREAGTRVAEEVEEQGAVLLKNDGVLPLKKGAKVTPIGYRYAAPLYGGTGSAFIDTTEDYVITPEKALEKYFSVNATVANALKSAEPEVLIGDGSNETTNIPEVKVNVYSGTEGSCKGTTAIVYIARPGSEGYDTLSTKTYEDGTKHQLQLTKNEKDAIEFAKNNCDQVIVMMVTASPMEIKDLQQDPKINAIIWSGLPGAVGYEAVSKIMDGEVNPSGKTSDIWYADFYSDPTYTNYLPTAYSNPVASGQGYFTEYEEGIYMGYRYYETRYAADNTFEVFGRKTDYDGAVIYPFGYGLHYENDKVTQTFDSVSYVGEKITVKGTISNKSSYDVDEVVEIYFGAPYKAGGIEKSAKTLLGFDKYHVKAGASTSFTLTFEDEELVSYDYKGIYSDNGSYVLENGEYVLYLGKNSHESWDEKSIGVGETKVYANTAKSGKAVGKRSSDEQVVENRFERINDYAMTGQMSTLSRSDFAGSYPKAPVSKALTEDELAHAVAFDIKTDARLGEVEGSLLYREQAPKSKAGNAITLSDMRGLSYDDPRWEELLENLDFTSESLQKLITYDLYQTPEVPEIGKPATSDHDGTVGWAPIWSGSQQMADMFGGGIKVEPVTSCAYPCAPIQAATWNREVMKRMGEILGEKGLTNGTNGWYAPGLNLHRSPFGGRNFEYYSEDPVLSGEISAVTVGGAFTNGGIYAYIKHFAVNDTDAQRSKVCNWLNEQALRELYLKSFEIVVKKAEGTENYYDAESNTMKTITVKACRGIMTSMSYIGLESPTNSYDLLTEVLRNEWGFRGMVITDMTSGNRSKDIGYRVGNDIWMAMRAATVDLSTPTAQWCARTAVKNVCYTVVNSNVFDKVGPGSYAYYDMSPWAVTLMGIDIAFYAVALAGIAWTIVRNVKGKKHPELFEEE